MKKFSQFVFCILCFFVVTSSYVLSRSAASTAFGLCWSGRYTETGEIPCACWRLVAASETVVKQDCLKDPGSVYCHKKEDCPGGITLALFPNYPSNPLYSQPQSTWPAFMFSW